MNYRLSELSEQVTTARALYRPIEIVGGATKRFYGNALDVPSRKPFRLHLSSLTGVQRYQPAELVMTAWAGTTLQEIDEILAPYEQQLPFDAPRYGSRATLGGAVASGLSGPLALGYGPVRHHVLGVRMLDAQGRVLRFGGEVIKNVAGYDVSRLMAGSLGIFGAMVEVSVRLMVRPARDITQALQLSQQEALDLCAGFRARPWPVRAAAWLPHDDAEDTVGTLCVRLAGSASAVDAAAHQLGGETLSDEEALQWWADFRDQKAAFFAQRPLWRVAVRAGTPAFAQEPCAFDMAGEVRWLVSRRDAAAVRIQAEQAGGHATFFRGHADVAAPSDGVFQPLAPAALRVVRRLKKELDPKGIFNPRRLVFEL